jgi:UDP-N-acetylmuramyl pentapeptide phosphotransferase/UDP-N-acetylglucosamine-1-phosphate transferase
MDLSLLLTALGLSFLLHFGIQKVFIFYKKFDDFNHRSSHKTLATRTGGIGIFSTLLLISLFFYFQGIEVFDYSLFIPLGIMFIVGVYDDFYNADFKLKFFLQIIVAKILIDQGFVISNYHGLFGLHEVNWLLAQLSTVFVFLVVVNAINFIDGIDGLAITEVIKTILLIELFSSNLTSLFPIGALVIASIIPLYYFNIKRKRKVFLGDGGSLLLGTLVMVYLLYVLGPNYHMSQDYQMNKALFSVLVILYPLVDLLRVFILRIKDGKSPFVADQRHLHHLLSKFTNSHWLTGLIILVFHLLIIYALFKIF